MSTTRAALARTYRPRHFSEMATQEHVSETLRTAVARGRTAHAYLFCGPRGVGKTTAARVLAMALNCPDRGEDGEPCGICESCERIWAGRTSLDVVEIDAASNRGVDDARDLRERAMYAPTDDRRFKIYIIDEAHMLTREAWNALLKILEEPPPRVIFVFATTEPQKIQQAAPPILSRCQRFDFRRIAVADIVARLRTVLNAEGIEAGDDALLPIARRADGGMRDALSLLDQVLSFQGGALTAEDVTRVLGLVGDELYLDLFDILAERRYGDVFRFVQRVLDDGYDLAEFYRGLADALRALLIARFDGPEAVDVRADLRTAYAAMAARFAPGDLLRMLSLVAELDTEGRLRKSTTPRTMLEALLLRFAFLDRTLDLEALLSGEAIAGDPAPPGRRSHPKPPAGGAGGRPTLPENSAARAAGRGNPPATAASPGARETGTASPAPAAVRHPTESPPPKPEEQRISPGAASGEDRGELTEVLRSLIAERKAPGGMAIFLKAASLAEPSPGELVLDVPPGPALERLSGDSSSRLALEAALAERLGRTIRLRVRAIGAAGDSRSEPVRLTPERVRHDQLARLARADATLERAVRDWDLELSE